MLYGSLNFSNAFVDEITPFGLWPFYTTWCIHPSRHQTPGTKPSSPSKRPHPCHAYLFPPPVALEPQILIPWDGPGVSLWQHVRVINKPGLVWCCPGLGTNPACAARMGGSTLCLHLCHPQGFPMGYGASLPFLLCLDGLCLWSSLTLTPMCNCILAIWYLTDPMLSALTLMILPLGLSIWKTSSRASSDPACLHYGSDSSGCGVSNVEPLWGQRVSRTAKERWGSIYIGKELCQQDRDLTWKYGGYNL